MKKRTAFVGAILSLMSFGHPSLIKTGVVISTSGLMLFHSAKVNAESAIFYYEIAMDKYAKRGLSRCNFWFHKSDRN